ncbi:MAG TPA: hypothetical protein VG895_02100 [Patescibacteria group bacterium]|nr:hypothetical protein [Patescibacteria group bacterium]
MSQTTEQVNFNRNRLGRGGFKDHPEHRNPGGRPKNLESFKYWLDYFKTLTVSEFLSWQKNTPTNKRTVAGDLAFAMILKARHDLASFRAVADITEGKPRQLIENAKEAISKVQVEIVENSKNKVQA